MDAFPEDAAQAHAFRPMDGAMLPEGEMRDATSGAIERQRIRWTAATDGSVRQLWQAQQPGGGQWTTRFDGTYRRRAGN